MKKFIFALFISLLIGSSSYGQGYGGVGSSYNDVYLINQYTDFPFPTMKMVMGGKTFIHNFTGSFEPVMIVWDTYYFSLITGEWEPWTPIPADYALVPPFSSIIVDTYPFELSIPSNAKDLIIWQIAYHSNTVLSSDVYQYP